MASRSIDFLVIGGGPGGSAFAILAARAGASVTLIERDDYQALRPGEQLAGRVRPLLDRLQIPRQCAAEIATPNPGILSLWNSDEGSTKIHAVTGQPIGLCVVRHRFDELLCESARAAGAAVVLRGRVVRTERRSARGWRVTLKDRAGRMQTIAARSIIDATGRNSSFARKQGARRISRGDLIAIVKWLDLNDRSNRAHAMLTVESCPYGWWSLSVVRDRQLVATFYTSLGMMRAARATAEQWWNHGLRSTDGIGSLVRECDATNGPMKVYRAGPSRLSSVVGRGWIAVGDAAIAFDPLAGQGVALAIETGFRAFEAACVDPSFELLAAEYGEAIMSLFKAHLDGRTRVYSDAASVLSPSFVGSAVMGRESYFQPGNLV